MSDNLMEEINAPRVQVQSSRNDEPVIVVMGVGGAGGNAVNNMYRKGIEGVTFMVCNTDLQALDVSPVQHKVQMGLGHGAGGDAEEGRRQALKSVEDVRQALLEVKADMLFITAGMGGGTGTGASPVIAKLARELNLLTVAVVTSPFQVEGQLRYDQAQAGIEELRKSVDSLLLIDNENIAKLYGRMSLKGAFSKADDILLLATKGIAEIITVKSDLVNVDFADVKRVMRDSGRAHMAVATAEGENRARQVVEESLNSPLLENNSIKGARKILINFVVDHPDHLIMDEAIEILKIVQSQATTRGEDGKLITAEIIWGTSIKESLGNALEMVMVATGFPQSAAERLIPEIKESIYVAPADEQPTGGLEPFKAPEQQPSAARAHEPIVLGAPSRRYENMDKRKEEPAFKQRGVSLKMHVEGHTSVVRANDFDAAPAKDGAEEQSASLF